MTHIQATTASNQGKHQRSSLASMFIGLILGLLVCTALTSGVFFALTTMFGNQAKMQVAHAAQVERHVQANLNIVINQPGMHKDWPAYTPTNLVLPAHSLVTITIRNYDLGDTPLPNNSPFTKVQGTIGGTASANGHTYSSLAADKVAHTFTILQLHVSVPVPGDAVNGASYAAVTFTIRTGNAGTYMFQCFDPCGTSSSGWMGPMMTMGYMMGTLTVQ
ncbi:MAG TPA: hypothetical protein VNG51_10425 [Ktedonobacteraceae bacterium]|nr:hypothetical protein [Ktedonobacteraceae bacterium]